MLRFILCGKDYAFLLATAGENPNSSPTDGLEWGTRHPAWAVGFVPSLKGLDPLTTFTQRLRAGLITVLPFGLGRSDCGSIIAVFGQPRRNIVFPKKLEECSNVL